MSTAPQSPSRLPIIVTLLAVLGAVALLVLWLPNRPPRPASTAATPSTVTPAPPPKSSSPPSTSASSSASTPTSPAPTATTPAPTPPASHPELDAALALADPRARSVQFGQHFQTLLNSDLAAALRYLRAMRRGPEYSQSLYMVIELLGRTDAPRALDLARELVSTRDERAVYSMLFDRFARENPAVALQRLALVPAGESRENALRALADQWLRQDPAAALAWAQTLPDPAERNAALESALRDLGQRDPRAAIDLALKFMSGAAQERTVHLAVQRLAAADPTAAATYAESMPPGDLQTMAIIDIARTLALRDIDSALAWIKTLRIDITQWLALQNVLNIWVQRDSAAASRHVMALPPGPGLDFASRHLGMLLAQKPKDAILWAEALPTTSARDAALEAIASTWAQSAPVEAVRWAYSLSDEPVRTNALVGAHSYWLLQDAPAARAWIETAALPADTKKVLRAGGGNR